MRKLNTSVITPSQTVPPKDIGKAETLHATTTVPHLPSNTLHPQIATLLKQGSGRFNEDTLLTANSIFGVFDGASSLKGQLFDGYSGAWWASHLACEAVTETEGTLTERMRAANNAIRQHMQRYSVPLSDRLALWSTSAAVVQINQHSFNFAQIGDALIIAIHTDDSFNLVTPYTNHDMETLNIWKKHVKEGASNLHESVGFHIKKTRLNMNKTFGVLNGEEEAEQFIASGEMPLDTISHILCFTDGLHLPCTEPELKCDFSKWVEIYLKHGINGLHQTIRETEKNDPQCTLYPRFKQHDDIAAVAISFPA